jgi:ribosomal protein S18 acetylase RimI-like enzyme
MKLREYNENDRSAVQNIFAKYWTDEEFLNELTKNIDEHKIHFYVAEKNSEIMGIAGFRKAPEYLSVHSETKNPAELYIIASKLQNEGIGSMLVQKVIEEARTLYFTEIECYSPETHNGSWKFYDNLGFTRGGIIKDPDDGYPGMLWKKII